MTGRLQINTNDTKTKNRPKTILMTPEQYKELNDRLNHLEDMLKDIRDKLNSPDYNISLTIPKPADCVGKCQSDLSIDQHKTAIPWE